MNRLKLIRPTLPALVTALIILAIAIILTWPLVLNFSTFIPGVDEDSATHIWYLWWFKWAFVEGNSNLFITDWIYHPQTINRIFDVHTFTNALLSLPFQYLFGVVAASNVIFYLNFFLSGLGMFLLAKKVTQNNYASFIASLIFVFMPYSWGQMLDNHTNLYTIWFIPFYLLFLIKTLEEKTRFNPIMAGLIFGLQALNDLTLTTFMILVTPLTLLYYVIFYPGTIIETSILPLRLKPNLINWPTIYRVVLIGLVTFIIFLPLLLPTFRAIMEGQDPGSPLAVQQVWSAQPQNFFLPSGNNPFLRQFSRVANVNAIEGSVYFGVTATILSLIGIIGYFKKSKSISKNLGLWLFIFASYALLSLGPCANYLGIKLDLPFCSGLPLPFVFFHKLPFIGGIQEPIRMQLYTMTALAILASFGIKLVTERFSKLALPLTAVLGALIIFEFYTPLPTTDLTPPPIYQTIGQESGDFAVLSLPVGWNNQAFNSGFSPIGSLQFFQTVHHKKSFRATVARIPTENIYYYLDKPLFKYITQPDKRVPDKNDLNPELVKKTFKDMNVKYIVYHKDLYAKKSSGSTMELLESVLGAKKISEDEETISYQIQ